MIIHTAAEGISLAKKLESEGTKFYEGLAKQFPEKVEAFLSFAKENQKFIQQIERAYYGVITDAIEGCFAFNLEADNFALDTAIPAKAAIKAVLAKAVKMEEKTIQYYTEAAEQSKSLMADVPRNFTLVSQKHKNRIEKLGSLS
jgi:rubrerythrin